MANNKVIYNGTTLIDLTGDTAVASDVAQGKTFHLADGTQATGTASGGGGDVKIEKDVNFIDYDGSIVYSYTADEFLGLAEMPANPSHGGLTAQGWNWTLSDAKTYVQKYGGQTIGQQYITDDGKTRAYITIEKGLLSIILGIYLNGTMIIDWGDNTSDTVTGSSTSSKTDTTHTYDEPGEYIISLTITGTAVIRGPQYNSYSEFIHGTINGEYYNYIYISILNKVELGTNISLGVRAFYNAVNLETITIPKTLNISSQYSFQNCYQLKAIVISESTNSLSSSQFSYSKLNYISINSSITTMLSQTITGITCKKIYVPESVVSLDNQVISYTKAEEIVIPDSVVTLYSNVCAGNYNLRKIYISPNISVIKSAFLQNARCLAYLEIASSVTSIEANAFSSCYGLKEIHFKPTTPPTLSNSNVFASLPSSCIIYVPTGSLSAYTSATNYPSASTYTYIEE